MNYYEKHIGDYIKDTVSLTMVEDGAYNRLIDQCYQTEKPLPLDSKEVYREARANTPAERKAVDYVLGKFFDKTNKGYIQKRVEVEIVRYQDKQRKAKASADARWSKVKTDTEGNANASKTHDAPDMRTHSEGNALQSPDTKGIPSEGKPSDGKPSGSPTEKSKSQLWKAAVSLLEGQGMAEPQARTFIGKLAKDYPDGEIVMKAVEGAVTEQPVDARAYLKAACQRLNGERKRDGGADWTAEAI